MRYLLIALLFPPIIFNAQITGKIVDSETNEGIFGVKTQSSQGERVITDTDGTFEILIKDYPVELYL
jgi:outer membrane receptor protein involved in Fe transport